MATRSKISAMTETERIQYYTDMYTHADNDALEDKLIKIDATVKALNALSKSVKNILGERLDTGSYVPVRIKVSTEALVPNLDDAEIKKDYAEYVREHAEDVAVWSKFVTQKNLMSRYKKTADELFYDDKLIIEKQKKFKV